MSCRQSDLQIRNQPLELINALFLIFGNALQLNVLLLLFPHLLHLMSLLKPCSMVQFVELLRDRLIPDHQLRMRLLNVLCLLQLQRMSLVKLGNLLLVKLVHLLDLHLEHDLIIFIVLEFFDSFFLFLYFLIDHFNVGVLVIYDGQQLRIVIFEFAQLLCRFVKQLGSLIAALCVFLLQAL